MKNLYRILIALLAFSFIAVSCKDKEYEYIPGEQDVAGCYGVYFPTQDASGSHVYDPTMDRSVAITVSRTNSSGAINVPYTVTSSEEGVFNFGTINFADGQTETELVVTFPNAKVGVDYSFSVQIEDNQYASLYNDNPIALDFSVLIVEMKTFKNEAGTADTQLTFYDKVFWKETHDQVTLQYYEVDGVRYCETLGGRLVPGTQGTEGAGPWGTDVQMKFKWYTNLKVEVNGEEYDFIEVDAQYHGWESSGTPIYFGDYFHMREDMGLSNGSYTSSYERYVKAQEYTPSYYDGHGGFMFHLAYWLHGTTSWYGYQDEAPIAIADGYVRVDYSLGFESDYTVEGVTPIDVEAGVDVASIKYAVYEGELTATQIANKVEGIIAGTEDGIVTFSDFAVDEEEAVKYATLGIQMDKTAYYTLVAVAYDSKDKAQNSSSITFRHVAASDTEEYAVDITVGTENVPERYVDYNDVSAFGYYVLGKGVTAAHVAVVPTASYERDPEGYAANIKAATSNALTEAQLAQVNAVGGFFALASGLNPNTSYTVLVWATNGDMDTVVTAEHSTAGLPLVFIAQGTYTYDGWWEGADDEQKLYIDPNYENTYVLTNWGGGVDFKFTMDDKGVIYIPTFYIGANHSTYGSVYYVDPYDWYSEAQMAADPSKAEHSYYDAATKTYNFHFVLAVSAGSFGHFWEKFTVDSEAAASVKKANTVSIKDKNPGKNLVRQDRIPAERDPQAVEATVSVSYDRSAKAGRALRESRISTVK